MKPPKTTREAVYLQMAMQRLKDAHEALKQAGEPAAAMRASALLGELKIRTGENR